MNVNENRQSEEIDFQDAVKTGKIVKGIVRVVQKSSYKKGEDILIVSCGKKKVYILASEVCLPLGQSLSSLVGQEIEMIITLAPSDVPIIYGSHKAVVAKKQKPEIDRLMSGAVMKGTIVRLLDYGAYVNVGSYGLNGLLKNVDFSDEAIAIKDVCHVGETIDVVLSSVSSKGNIHLKAAEKYVSDDTFTIDDFEEGQLVYGTVVDVKTFAVYVRIAPLLDVMCPHPNNVSDVTEGQKMLVRIRAINEQEKKIRGFIIRPII